MKKWLTGIFVVIIVVLVAGIYIVIPGELVVSKVELVNCNANGAFRVMSEGANREKWLSQKGEEGYSFRVSGKFYPEIEVFLEKDAIKIGSRITILTLQKMDSIALQWRCSFRTSLNPVKRALQYRQAVNIKDNMTAVLSDLRAFLEKKESIYGMDVRDEMSGDSTLLAAKLTTASYPGTADIYQLVGVIRAYIASHGAKETNRPMLHVTQLKDDQFETMVAIPTDRELNGNGRLFPKRYVPWKIVTGEVKGGVYTAEHALDQLQRYVEDHHRMAMGIPFQSLVTERDLETDTSRWITRVVQAVP